MIKRWFQNPECSVRRPLSLLSLLSLLLVIYLRHGYPINPRLESHLPQTAAERLSWSGSRYPPNVPEDMRRNLISWKKQDIIMSLEKRWVLIGLRWLYIYFLTVCLCLTSFVMETFNINSLWLMFRLVFARIIHNVTWLSSYLKLIISTPKHENSQFIHLNAISNPNNILLH